MTRSAPPRGPLAPEVYDTSRPVRSWWEASAPAPCPRAALAGDLSADVAIIGGGYTGLTAARRLAELGLEAAVLDGGEIGWGASGRNGGIAGPGGHKLSETALLRRHGHGEVARYHRAQAENLRALRRFCEKAGLRAQVQGAGEAVYAHSPRAAWALEAEAPAPGFRLEPLVASGAGDLAHFGGSRTAPAFGIHPLRLVRALADAAEAAGARVLPRSPVTEWHRDGASHRLVTPGGSVTARRVLIATNGFTPDGLHHALDARAIPVISNIAVTRVLTDAERARHPWLGVDPVCDTRHMLAYLRLLPEGRLLYGMRGDATGADANAEAMKARVAARIARDLPGFADAEIEYFWRGPICATTQLTPSVGWLDRARGIACALGWHGSGIGMGTLAGPMVAEVIAGAPEATIPAPMRGPAPRLPFPGLRPVYVRAAMAGLALHDRMS